MLALNYNSFNPEASFTDMLALSYNSSTQGASLLTDVITRLQFIYSRDIL